LLSTLYCMYLHTRFLRGRPQSLLQDLRGRLGAVVVVGGAAGVATPDNDARLELRGLLVGRALGGKFGRESPLRAADLRRIAADELDGARAREAGEHGEQRLVVVAARRRGVGEGVVQDIAGAHAAVERVRVGLAVASRLQLRCFQRQQALVDAALGGEVGGESRSGTRNLGVARECDAAPPVEFRNHGLQYVEVVHRKRPLNSSPPAALAEASSMAESGGKEESRQGEKYLHFRCLIGLLFYCCFCFDFMGPTSSKEN